MTTSTIHPPSALCILPHRWDLSLELCFHDHLQQPRPLEFYVRRKLIDPQHPAAGQQLQAFNHKRRHRPIGRWMAVLPLWYPGTPAPVWFATNGDEWLRIAGDGLVADLCQRLERHGLEPRWFAISKPPAPGNTRPVASPAYCLHDAREGQIRVITFTKLTAWLRVKNWPQG
jgi:hypothetical protein